MEGFAEGFRAELVASGYAWRTVEVQLGLVKHLSTWLGAQGLMAGDLGPEVTSRFVEARRQSHTHLRSPRALVAVLGYLRGLGVAPPPEESASTPAEVIEQEFARYLAQRRLAPATVSSYRSHVRPFLARCAEVDGGWASVTARQVRDFVTDGRPVSSPGRRRWGPTRYAPCCGGCGASRSCLRRWTPASAYRHDDPSGIESGRGRQVVRSAAARPGRVA